MFKKCVAWYLVTAMFVLGIAPRVEGAFSPSEAIALSEAQRDADIGKLRAVLENKVVVQRLQDLGFSQEEIASRLSGLSDEQLHGLAQRVDDIRVGGDGLGVVIALLVIVILVIIILQLTSHKVVIQKQ
jgi:hypothetical protein